MLYSYDNVGNVTRKTNASDNSYSEYTYNSRGLLTGITYSDSTQSVTYGYNNLDLRSSMTDGNGLTTYSYDSLNRLTSASNSVDGTISYSYDKNSNLASLEYPNGNHVTYTFDDNDQMLDINESHAGKISYAYNVDNLLTSTTYPNGIKTSNTYDGNNRVNSIESKDGNNSSVLNLDYNYDDTGLITLQTTTDPTATTSKGYTYDLMSRMNQVSTGGTTDGEYSFDTLHNVTANPTGDALSYNAQNQLTNKTNSVTETDVDYVYDSRGNRTQENKTTISGSDSNTLDYNVANQLITANLGANPPNVNHLGYTYNGDGLRNSKTKTVGGVTKTNKYIWDSNSSIPELLENSNTVYIYGVTSTPIAQIDKSTNNVTYLHSDKIGSVRATSNSNGAITSRADYDEYGNITNGSRNTAFGFAGEYQDADTGYYYLRARWYDPSTAQFITVDPLLNTTHLAYGYTAGNPLSYTDPLGLDFLGDLGQVGLGVLDGVTGGLSTMLLDAVAPGVVNHCSDAFAWSSGISSVLSMFIPGAAALHAVGLAAHAFSAIKGAGVLAGAVASAGKIGKVEKAIAHANPTSLFHYTNEVGQKGILASKELRASLKAKSPKDARYGDGQYLSDIKPGTYESKDLAGTFIGMPFPNLAAKFSHYVEIDVTGLDIIKGRENVFVNRTQDSLDLTNRIIGYGKN